MRIIGGRFSSRNFNPPKSHTAHPMSEKMRGALFSAIGDIEGLTVLDAYGGSGAIGFEAASRGAKEVQVLEIDRNVQDLIKQNIEGLGLSEYVKSSRANCISWVKNTEAKFDVVIADPPYDKVNFEHLEKLSIAVADRGLYVVSHGDKSDVPKISGFKLVKNSNYGDGNLAFYKR